MATTQNAGDILLAATSPRMDTIPFTTLVDFANVTGSTKPADNATKNNITMGTLATRPVGSNGDIYYASDTTPPTVYKKIGGVWVVTSTINTGAFALLSGQVTSSNYATYLGDRSISDRAFSQNVGAAAATQTVSVTLAPDTRDIILTFGGLLIGATAGSGNTIATLSVKENGSFIIDTRVIGNIPNISTTYPMQIPISHSKFRTSTVPSGSITYDVIISANPNPVGSTGELIRWAFIQALVLKR